MKVDIFSGDRGKRKFSKYRKTMLRFECIHAIICEYVVLIYLRRMTHERIDHYS